MIITSVKCDRCTTTISWPHWSSESWNVTHRAIAAGWVDNENGDLCPDCKPRTLHLELMHDMDFFMGDDDD